MTFEEYVATRGPALVRFARLLTGDRHHAEDLVQEALSKAYLSGKPRDVTTWPENPAP